MNLHVETIGSGQPLILLHGWGMHGGIWRDVAQHLAEKNQVHCVDLPGHGLSAMDGGGFTLEEVVNALSTRFTEPLNLCGWSLGGQIALHWAAREPDKIQRLMLVASTPCFTQRDDWACAMSPENLRQFATDLEENHTLTLRRFLSLQVRGSDNERELLSLLRDQLLSRGEPNLSALRGGLAILRDADQRSVLPNLVVSSLLIAGERDKLTPAQASEYMAEKIPNARLEIIAGAAHAPFLSHQREFLQRVEAFLARP